MAEAHRSNRLEALAHALAEVIETPLSSPSAKDTILVPSGALAARLSTEVAKRRGVWANPDFETPRAWLAALTRSGAAAADPSQIAMLRWSIAATPLAFLGEAVFAEVHRYLSEGTKRLPLAERCARGVARNVLRRPKLVASWKRGEATHWQPKRFHAFAERHGDTHFAARVDALVADLSSATPKGLSERLPPSTSASSRPSSGEHSRRPRAPSRSTPSSSSLGERWPHSSTCSGDTSPSNSASRSSSHATHALRRAPVRPALLILGDPSAEGNSKPIRSFTEPLPVEKDDGAKRALIPSENKRNFLDVNADITEHVAPHFFGDATTAAVKELGS